MIYDSYAFQVSVWTQIFWFSVDDGSIKYNKEKWKNSEQNGGISLAKMLL